VLTKLSQISNAVSPAVHATYASPSAKVYVAPARLIKRVIFCGTRAAVRRIVCESAACGVPGGGGSFGEAAAASRRCRGGVEGIAVLGDGAAMMEDMVLFFFLFFSTRRRWCER
jgi:hypothetical protein